MIGIIGALDAEIELLLAHSEVIEVTNHAGKRFVSARFANMPIVIAKSGIGKVNATITATLLCTLYPIDFVINIGVAGGVGEAEVGDIVVAKGISYFDVSLVDIDSVPYGQMGDDPLVVEPDRELFRKAVDLLKQEKVSFRVGNIVSGDSFVTRKAILEPILKEVSDVVACEMEGMAIALTCRKFEVPFLSIRGISDLVQGDDQSDGYRLNMERVASMTTGFVAKFLEAMNE